MGTIVDLGNEEVLTQRLVDRRIRIQHGVAYLDQLREVIATPDFFVGRGLERLEARMERPFKRISERVLGVHRNLEVATEADGDTLTGGFTVVQRFHQMWLTTKAFPDGEYGVNYHYGSQYGIDGGGPLDRLEEDQNALLIRPFIAGARWSLDQVVECIPTR